jgi:TPR repeat protein
VQQALVWATALCALWALFLLALKRPLSVAWHLRRPHWVQVLMHSTIFVYWGMHVELVRDMAPLILAQIPLAYSLDLLISWTRGRPWLVGVGPIPIIGSINLFLWFKDEGYAWQLVMVALAFVGKELLQWGRGEERRHIFNPSALALSLVSLVLLFTHSSSVTWGQEISTRLLVAPHMFEVIFGVGLVVQLLFGVGFTTAAAALTAWGLGALWYRMSGEWAFVDTAIPISVFLGMNLLITDPATSPRNAVGKALFGALYGALTLPLVVLLPLWGQPSFYDKLLQVPLCNLLAPPLERFGAKIETWWGATPFRWLTMNNMGLAVMWGGAFLVMRPELLNHPGSRPETWKARCAKGEGRACVYLRHTLEKGCGLNKPERCAQLAESLSDPEALDRNEPRATLLFQKACQLGQQSSCLRHRMSMIKTFSQLDPQSQGAQGAKKPQVDESMNAPMIGQVSEDEAIGLACEGGQPLACLALARQLTQGQVAPNPTRLAWAFERACELSDPRGCVNLGLMLLQGREIPPNPARARTLHEKACELGEAKACGRLGVLYRRGVGGPPDEEAAQRAFKTACEGGDAASCRASSPWGQ